MNIAQTNILQQKIVHSLEKSVLPILIDVTKKYIGPQMSFT